MIALVVPAGLFVDGSVVDDRVSDHSDQEAFDYYSDRDCCGRHVHDCPSERVHRTVG